jgi:hypothetical protein
VAGRASGLGLRPGVERRPSKTTPTGPAVRLPPTGSSHGKVAEVDAHAHGGGPCCACTAQHGRPAGGALASEAGAGMRQLDHRASRAAQGDLSAGRVRLIPSLTPCRTNELIGSREQNWLTSKALMTAVRAHAIGSVTLQTGP